MSELKPDENELQYLITFERRVEFLGQILFPGKEYKMRGDAVNKLIEHVKTASLVGG